MGSVGLNPGGFLHPPRWHWARWVKRQQSKMRSGLAEQPLQLPQLSTPGAQEEPQRTLAPEWEWKSLSHVQLFATTCATQPMNSSRPEYSSGGSLSLHQWTSLAKELNQSLLHCRWSLYQLSYHRGADERTDLREPRNLHFALHRKGLNALTQEV